MNIVLTLVIVFITGLSFLILFRHDKKKRFFLPINRIMVLVATGAVFFLALTFFQKSKLSFIGVLVLLPVLYKLHLVNAEIHRNDILNLLKDGFIIFDKNANVKFANMAAERLLGVSAGTIKKVGISFVHKKLQAVVFDAIETGIPQSGLVKVNRLFLLIRVNIGIQLVHRERLNIFSMQIEDVSEFIPNHKLIDKDSPIINEVVQGLIYHDHLTDSLNRRYFDEKIPDVLMESVRAKYLVCLLLLDIDYFKEINDKNGHSIGDMVLKHVADTMRRISRKDDLVFRLGGDEFALILVNTPKEIALLRAQQLCSTIEKNNLEDFREGKISFTVSIGLAMFPNPAITLDQLLQFADKALYQAKADGRNCVRGFGDIP